MSSKETLRHTMLVAAAHIPVAMTAARTPPHILLIRPDHLGDLLFMTPALHALRAALPGAHITCLTGPWGRPVLDGNPDIDDLLTLDFPWFNRRPKPPAWQPYTLLWQQARLLRRQHFDAAIIMRFDFWWGAALARLAGIPLRIGYNIGDVQPFLTHAVPYTPGRHEVLQNLALIHAAIAALVPQNPVGDATPVPILSPLRGDASTIAGAAPIAPLRFTIAADAAWAAAHLPDTPAAGYIAIHAGAGAAVKLWSADAWVRVANELGKRYGAAIILTGGPGEVQLVDSIAGRLSVPHISLAGKTSLGQLAAVYARCRLVLGPDSGPLHLAVAAGAPTIHLFGPVDPLLFGPWGDPQRQVVVQARYFDLPCHYRPCNRLDYSAAELPSHPCMQTITVDDVLAAAARLL